MSRRLIFVAILPLVLSFDCTSRKDGLYPSVSIGCTDVFWKCWNEQAFRYTCPHDLFYRTDAEYCDYEENVPNCKTTNLKESSGQQLGAFDCNGRPDDVYVQRHLIEHTFRCSNGESSSISVTVNKTD
ncbi:Chitin binding Peritrophin-A domain protein [Aphelenchoides besseyi]|nr:Chitin binding Peritrophin-A domain protein [Aphelenchoides besseyi]